VPSGPIELLVPPTMLRTRPITMSNRSKRKCMTVKVGVDFALMESTLYCD
jgi:hypothetical protein